MNNHPIIGNTPTVTKTIQEKVCYGSGKSLNSNHVNRNEQFTDVNFVFSTRNNIPQYVCLIYSIKLISKNIFFNHLKYQYWKNKSPVTPPMHGVHFAEPLPMESSIIPKTVTFGFCQNFTIPIEIHIKITFNAKRKIKTKSFINIPPTTAVEIPIIYKIQSQ